MGDVYMVNGKILSGLPNHAKDIEFDNTGTDLTSTNTEDAIKEVNSNLPTHRATGITVADLYAIINTLSDIEFANSKVILSVSGNSFIFFPVSASNKLYTSNFIFISDTSQIGYYYKLISTGLTVREKKLNGTLVETAESFDSWTIIY